MSTETIATRNERRAENSQMIKRRDKHTGVAERRENERIGIPPLYL
jgi:glutaredoxin-related protein